MGSRGIWFGAAWVLGVAGCGDDANVGPADSALSDGALPDSAVSDVAVADAGPDLTLDAAEDGGDDGAEDGVADTTTAPEPGEPGPFRVGYRVESVTYAPADGSPDRTLRLALWYPTDATDGDEVLYGGLLPADGVLGDVPLTEAEAPRPVVVFSHGNTSFAEQSHFLTTFLASHGFVVAAPDHTGNTFTDRDTTPEIFHYRPLDVGAVIDHLEALEAPHFLAARLGDGVALTGHSFGGYSTLAAAGATWDVDSVLAYCETEALPLGACEMLGENEALYRSGFGHPSVRVAIPMSPGATLLFGESGAGDVDAPVLLLTATLDRTTTNDDDGDPTWAALAGDARHLRVDFTAGGHFTFSNACDLPLDATLNDGCGPDFIAPAVAHRIINAYTLAFIERHLLGDEGPDPVLDADPPPYEDIQVSRGGSATAE